MERRQTLPTGLFWKYGLIGGLIIIAISLLQGIFGLEESYLFGTLVFIADLVVLGVVIFMGIKTHRDQFHDGYIRTGKAFATGFFIAAIVGLIVAIFTFINYQFINPDVMRETIDRTIAQMEDQGLSEEQIEQSAYWMRFMATPAATAVIALVSHIFFGLILSLIGALILNREESDAA